jgi:HEAT repeats
MKLRWTKRLVLWMGAALIFAGALLALLSSTPKEPEYQGRKLSVWLEAANGSYPQIAVTSAWAAVHAVGADGLPWLLTELQARDSFLRNLHIVWERKILRSTRRPLGPEYRHVQARAGLAMIGDAALPAIPELAGRLSDSNVSVSARFALDAIAGGLKSHLVNKPAGWTNVPPPASPKAHAAVVDAYLASLNGDKTWAKAESLYALGMYPEDATRILPAALRYTRDKSEMVRGAAAWVLGKFAREPVPVIPELIRLLDDPAAPVRRNAAFALGKYYRQAKTAVPRLLDARRDPDPEVRKVANESLDQIDPETAAAIPDLPAFKP